MDVGELFWIGFEGTIAPPSLLEALRARRAGGVVLFARNLGAPHEIHALNAALQAARPDAALPLPICIDQEGGRVQRIKAPLPHWPPMGKVADAARAESVGRAMGEELAALGCNIDFAPVLDVHTNPQNPIIGDRAFANEPAAAATLALAYWRGLEAAGVRGCGKHFPGHGDTALDSHLDLPHVDAPLSRLREVELAPFARAVKAGVPMMMTAHVVYPQVDSWPATMSPRWLTEILRGEFGYDGLIVSDDLDMKAVAARWPVEETVERAVLAGVDIFLACRDADIQARALAGLTRAAEKSAVREKLEQSYARVARFRKTLRVGGAFDAFAALPLAAHQQLADSFR
jgi:beta-N-acetylhexosaminidase